MPKQGEGETRGWRMFCAFALPHELRSEIGKHILRVREVVPDAAASFSRPENIHLTLKFFGNVAVERVAGISEAATRATQDFSPFEIEVGATGVFPKPSRAQVLWLGIGDLSGRLAALQQRLEAECAREGFVREERAFRPHLTIARIRKPQNANRLAKAHLEMKFSNVAVRLADLIVFRSELSPQGSKYTQISTHGFER